MISSMQRRGWLRASLAALALVLPALDCQAQAYPARPVRLILPFPAGGTADAVTRHLAHKMSLALGKPFVVDNVVGAAGTIGLAQGLRAAPDGYTITQISNTNTVAALHMFKRLPFDPRKDMVPVASLFQIPSAVVTNSRGSAFGSFAEMLAYARANPGKLSYAYSHATGAVAGASVKQASGIDIVAVPYKSGPQAVVETLSGEMPLLFTDLGAVLPQIRAGKLKALAVTSAQRSALLPDVPTLREVLPGATEFTGWSGFVVPVGTPRAVVDKLHETLQQILGSEDTASFLRGLGGEPMPMSADEFARFIKDQEPLWAKALAAAGIAPE
jgi:tripartite-type tricarboxylate transporter receptor subunit TctC